MSAAISGFGMGWKVRIFRESSGVVVFAREEEVRALRESGGSGGSHTLKRFRGRVELDFGMPRRGNV